MWDWNYIFVWFYDLKLKICYFVLLGILKWSHLIVCVQTRWVTRRVGWPVGFGHGSEIWPMGRVLGTDSCPFVNRVWVWNRSTRPNLTRLPGLPLSFSRPGPLQAQAVSIVFFFLFLISFFYFPFYFLFFIFSYFFLFWLLFYWFHFVEKCSHYFLNFVHGSKNYIGYEKMFTRFKKKFTTLKKVRSWIWKCWHFEFFHLVQRNVHRKCVGSRV